MKTNNLTQKDVLAVIAKQLKKIAKELKQANELKQELKQANEPTYELTEKGKALLEQSCEEVNNTPSNNELIEAAKLIKYHCMNCFTSCNKVDGSCPFDNPKMGCILSTDELPERWDV